MDKNEDMVEVDVEVADVPEILEEAVERIENEVFESNWNWINNWGRGGNWQQHWQKT